MANSLQQKVEQYSWYHSIDLGHGIVTPGHKTPENHRLESSRFFDPIDLDGASVIDIGAWDGFYSFEAKRRGAKRVVASDHYVWTDPSFRARETFDLARSALDVDIEALEIDVPELSVERVGTFDVVLFLGVFYHLFDPIDGLARVAKLARDVLVVETHLDLLDFARPAMVFYPGSELAGDASNWWGPNPACVVALLSSLGFAKIDATWITPFFQYDAHSVGGRAVFHAWRSETRRRSEPPAHLAIQPPPRTVDTSLAVNTRERDAGLMEVELARVTRERDAALLKVETMASSKSWRLTAPLRDARRWLARISDTSRASVP